LGGELSEPKQVTPFFVFVDVGREPRRARA
jgi:hypothetical protein